MIKFLIDNGADIKLQGRQVDNNISAFIIAVNNEAVEIIDFLLSIYTPSLIEMGDTVCNSISKRNFRLTEKLLKFLNTYKNSWKEEDYLSQILGRVLGITVANGDYNTAYIEEMIKILFFKYGEDVNAKDSDGETALMLTAEYSSPKIIEILLQHGADVNAKDSIGVTALMLATEHSSPEAIEILLQHGADINAMTDHNFTALTHSLRYPKTENVKILLKAGANTNVYGFFADYAWDNILSIEKFRNDAEIVKLTLRNCPDNLIIKSIFKSFGILEKLADDIDDDYGTALAMLAYAYDYDEEADNKEIILDIVRALAEFKKNYGWTALMYASAFCKKGKTISALLKANPNINVRDSDGWTALMCAAAFNDNQEIISTLIDSGADLNAINSKGNTALDLARENGNNSAIKLLEAINADEL